MDSKQQETKEARQFVYFDKETDELVVKTTNGKIINGKNEVRLYGSFICSAEAVAKLLAIINGKIFKFQRDTDMYIAMDDTETAAEIRKWQEAVKKSVEHFDNFFGDATIDVLRQHIEYWEMPWYKRIFRKPCIKSTVHAAKPFQPIKHDTEE